MRRKIFQETSDSLHSLLAENQQLEEEMQKTNDGREADSTALEAQVEGLLLEQIATDQKAAEAAATRMEVGQGQAPQESFQTVKAAASDAARAAGRISTEADPRSTKQFWEQRIAEAADPTKQ